MAQSWLQLSIRTGAADIDTFSNFVIERGSPGIVVKRDGLDAFFPRSRKDAALRREVRRFVDAHARHTVRARQPRLRWKVIQQENWQQSWKRFIKPRRVGESFWVTPPWLTPPHFRRRQVITIEPGMAFGTGTHATTRACMEFLEIVRARVGAGKFTGLDVGTGSGILAIALALLGASEIRAIDNDPVAVKVAAENLHVNRVVEKVQSKRDEAQFDQTGFHRGGRQPHRGDDWRTCRSTAKTSSARRISHFIGNLVSESERHRSLLFAEKFRLLERRRRQEWVTLLLRRKD